MTVTWRRDAECRLGSGLPDMGLRVPLIDDIWCVRLCWWRGRDHVGVKAYTVKAVGWDILHWWGGINHHLAIVKAVIVLNRIPLWFIKCSVSSTITMAMAMAMASRRASIEVEFKGILRVSWVSGWCTVTEMSKSRVRIEVAAETGYSLPGKDTKDVSLVIRKF